MAIPGTQNLHHIIFTLKTHSNNNKKITLIQFSKYSTVWIFNFHQMDPPYVVVDCPMFSVIQSSTLIWGIIQWQINYYLQVSLKVTEFWVFVFIINLVQEIFKLFLLCLFYLFLAHAIFPRGPFRHVQYYRIINNTKLIFLYFSS